MRIGDEVYVHGYVDEIRYDDTKRVSTVIIRNDGGYFGTVPSEIDNAPTIDAVSVVHGEWIESNLIKDGRIFICSNCNMAWVSKKRTMDGMNYCPNCGADMRGDNDGKDIQSADE